MNIPTLPNPVERIFDDFHALVFRTAYRITGNAADAEDVLQQVFLRLVRRGASAGPIENPEAYLRRAAINVSLDVVRARQGIHTVPLETSRAGPDDHPELRESLRRALASLPAQAAEVFALRYLEGFTNPEIARLLGLSKVHVAVLLFRTRKQLQKKFQSPEGVKP